MKFEKVAKEIACEILKKMAQNGLGRNEFLDVMSEAYMVSIIAYCKVEELDPLEALTLFHQKAEEISLRGHDEARRELEQRQLELEQN